ncbi:MAG: hypothetical protein D6788_03490 [Planctomycetota bacterium]|nr:MAG: hypothetical protein D6788_03490 [Planctomycetota bacterium]
MLVSCAEPRIRKAFAALYRGYPTGEGGEPDVSIEIRPDGRDPVWRRRYRILADGEPFGPPRPRGHVLPFLEWAINWRILSARPEFVQLHAAALVRDGRGLLLAGTSGVGKSTLSVTLLARGWRFLTDELALLEPESDRVHPCPKAVCLRAPMFQRIAALGLRLAGRRYHVKGVKGRVGYINPLDVSPDALAPVSPIRCVLFPRYVPGTEPRLEPLSVSRAVLALTRCALNAGRFSDGGVKTFRRLLDAAPCFELISGDLARTCDLLDTLMGEVHAVV